MEELKKEPLTAVLMGLNILVFLISEFTGGSENISNMLEMGAAFTPYIVEGGQFYRLFTCMFLHFGMAHLANNMLVLFVLGGRLERTVGKIRFLLIYLLGGAAGNVLSLVFDLRSGEFAVSAGASGAVFAVTGALLYVIFRNKGRVEDLSARQMVVMAALSLYLGFAEGGVDNAAHAGGLLGGFVMAVLLYHPSHLRKI